MNRHIIIYQIKNIAKCDYAFREYNEDKFDINDYKIVFEYDEWQDKGVGDMRFLEHIFCKFNFDDTHNHIPANYLGHSLSVSDVVCLDNDMYYCDDIGWTKIN